MRYFAILSVVALALAIAPAAHATQGDPLANINCAAVDLPAEASAQAGGAVKWFSDTKGYGIIVGGTGDDALEGERDTVPTEIVALDLTGTSGSGEPREILTLEVNRVEYATIPEGAGDGGNTSVVDDGSRDNDNIKGIVTAGDNCGNGVVDDGSRNNNNIEGIITADEATDSANNYHVDSFFDVWTEIAPDDDGDGFGDAVSAAVSANGRKTVRPEDAPPIAVIKVVDKASPLLFKADAKRALDALIDATAKSLKKGNRVALVGFGSFSVSKRAARKGRNPQTGKEIKIPARKTAKFKPGKNLSEAVK